jgi:uncharacterized protein
MSEQQADSKPKVRAPRVNHETKVFWDATAEGKLLVKKCNGCGENHYYPRTLCPFCFCDDTEYLECSGRGVIYSYSVTRRTKEPWAIAYVTLEEGPTMMTNLIDCDFDELSIGQAVEVAFVDTGENTALPFFRPV